MKVILTQKVGKLGQAGDLVEVKDGYGRNFLLPQGQAVVATPGATKHVASMKKAQDAKTVRDREHANEVKQHIEKIGKISIDVKTAATGKIFGRVSGNDIALALKAAQGPNLDKKKFVFPQTLIKNIGQYPVTVNIHEDITAQLTVEVVAENVH